MISTVLILISKTVESRGFENHETVGNLLVMDENESFDFLFLGISHARNFSQFNNHKRVEDILTKKVINLGQGSGKCGVNEQLFYLDYFYYNQNKVSSVVYFISPPLFFSNELPLDTRTFYYEPFEFSFLLRYIFFDSENKVERIIAYLQSKIKGKFINLQPDSTPSKQEKLENIDTNLVNEGQALVYKNTLALDRFNKSTQRVKETINLALKHHSKVVLIIPPALFGKWRGHNNVAEFASEMEKIDGVEFYDFSESMLTPAHYYDHHHLNTEGINFFTEHYLKPIFKNKSSSF